jgi:hypothetical protein
MFWPEDSCTVACSLAFLLLLVGISHPDKCVLAVKRSCLTSPYFPHLNLSVYSLTLQCLASLTDYPKLVLCFRCVFMLV